MIRRPPLLILTALVAGISAVAGAVAQGDPAEGRFGTGIRQQLSERDRAAAARARQLDLREQAAKAAEKRMAGAAPAAAPATPATPTPPPEPEPSEGERLEDLAKIYQAMKPKSAAPIFEQLTLEVQVKVASRMRDRSAAAIMAAMTPKAAAMLSMAIAKRRTSYEVLTPGGSPLPSPAARP
jgi:flagellar motility protein MotE (MotC chaperone)